MLGEDEQQDQQLRSKFNCSNNNDADSNNNSSSSNSGSVGVGVDDYYLSHLQPSLALALPHVLGALTPLALPSNSPSMTYVLAAPSPLLSPK